MSYPPQIAGKVAAFTLADNDPALIAMRTLGPYNKLSKLERDVKQVLKRYHPAMADDATSQSVAASLVADKDVLVVEDARFGQAITDISIQCISMRELVRCALNMRISRAQPGQSLDDYMSEADVMRLIAHMHDKGLLHSNVNEALQR